MGEVGTVPALFRFGAPSFDMAAEDFPALPGSSGAGGGGAMDAAHVPSSLGGDQGQVSELLLSAQNSNI